MVGISCAILILLFIFQRVGTSKVGFTFSPIVIAWYVLNGGCGIFNIARYYPGVFKVSRARCETAPPVKQAMSSCIGT